MRRWLKSAGYAIGGIAALAVIALIVLNAMSIVREWKTYTIPATPLAIASDAAAIERGRHLATAIGGCRDCHDDDLGGKVLVDNLAMGRIVASNLTRGSGGLRGDHTDQDFVRAIRHGVNRESHSLIFMPSESFQGFSDSDLAAIIAWLRTVAPVDRRLPPTRVGPLARAIHILGFPLLPAELFDHGAAGGAPAPGVTAAYGEYLARVGGCHGCHGGALAGGEGPGPNITKGAIGAWTTADFKRALREGKRPDGSPLAEPMPWKVYAKMTDEEIDALWLYERSLPAVIPK